MNSVSANFILRFELISLYLYLIRGDLKINKYI